MDRICPPLPPGYVTRDAYVERSRADGSHYLEQVVEPETYDDRLAACHAARLAEYPKIGDQLDALFKARAGDDSGLRAIDNAIARVKAAYPKPSTPC